MNMWDILTKIVDEIIWTIIKFEQETWQQFKPRPHMLSSLNCGRLHAVKNIVDKIKKLLL